MLAPSRSIQPIYVMIDSNNILGGAKNLAETLGYCEGEIRRLRIHATNFARLVLSGSAMGRGSTITVTTNPKKGIPEFLSHYVRLGMRYDVVYRNAEIGREPGDDRLLLRLYELCPRDFGVVALATGDGNGHKNGQGFVPALNSLHERGHKVELYSWKGSLNPALQNRVNQIGKTIYLDEYFSSITFVEGGRGPTPLRHR